MKKIIQRFSKASIAISLVLIFLWEIRKGYFKNFFTYLKSLPLKFYGIGAAIIGVLFAGTFAFDEPLYRLIHQIDTHLFQKTAQLGGVIGRNVNFWYGMIAIYAVNLFFRKKGRRMFAFGLMLSGMLSGFVTYLMKTTFLRARPEAFQGAYSFFHWESLKDGDNLFRSLPSGDVALVAGACAFLFFMARKTVWRWLVLLLPILTAFSRILTESHWPSDTILAFGIGILAAKFVSGFHKSEI